MTSIGRLTRLTLFTVLAAGLSGCIHLEDSVTQYVDRTDKVTVSAGNAKDSNVAIHMIDPWPRVSANRRLETNAARMAGAYERYRDVSKVQPRPVITPPMSVSSSSSSSGGGVPASGGAR
jgi:hypothetical protein